MEPARGGAASGLRKKVVGAYAMSWVAGVGPVEPHTEVADHARPYVYDGIRRPGRPQELDPARCCARGRAARRAHDPLRPRCRAAAGLALAGSALLLRGRSDRLRAIPASE